MPRALAMTQVVHISVYHHDAVVHYHAQRDDESGQRDGVHLIADDVHDRDGDGCSKGYFYCRDERRGDGEKHQHDGNDHKDGREQVFEERPDAVVHHFGEVSNAGEVHPVGQHTPEILQHNIYILAELDNIVARTHLDAQHQGLVAVLCDIAGGDGIAALYARHILQPDSLSPRGSVYHLFAQLALRLVWA